MSSPLLSHVHHHFLGLVCVEDEFVLFTPSHPTGHLTPIRCFHAAGDRSNDWGVVSTFPDGVVLVRGDAVVCELCVEHGAENTSLRGTSVHPSVLMASANGSIAIANNKGDRGPLVLCPSPNVKYREHLPWWQPLGGYDTTTWHSKSK